MNFNYINNLIDEFLNDENLLKATNWQKDINIFDICGLDEPRHSAFLSWLFNPRESHQLGDLAMKQVLKESLQKFAYLDNDDKRKRALSKNSFFRDNGNEWTIFDVNSNSFNETIVYREFKAGKSINGKYPRIDLCLVCEEQELIIFIENKYGCPEGIDQTPKYYNYLINKFGREYSCLFIYLDRYYNDKKTTTIDEHWIILNYDWIKKLLKSVITQKSYSDYTEKILKDYYIFITDDYNFEPYYSVCNDPIKQLSRNHRALLRQLREAKSDRHKGALIKGLEFEQIEELCSRETKKNSIYRKLYNLYNKYWGILDEMENYSFHDLLGDSLQKELAIDESLIEIDSYYVAVTHKVIAGLRNDHEWPIYLEFYENTRNGNDHFEFYIYFDLSYIPDNYIERVKRFIKENSPNSDHRINRRYNKLS